MSSDDDDKMDVESAIRTLNQALELQFRSALETTYVAGTLTGPTWHPLSQQLLEFAGAELQDAGRVVQKTLALGGEPTTEAASFSRHRDPEQAVRALVDHETECCAAFHAVIPHSGQEPRSEALEHLMEHILLRKQAQIDSLNRVLGG